MAVDLKWLWAPSGCQPQQAVELNWLWIFKQMKCLLGAWNLWPIGFSFFLKMGRAFWERKGFFY